MKGRKKGGGGRVGEMERDALISHGTPFLMQDRFMDCSDKATVSILLLIFIMPSLFTCRKMYKLFLIFLGFVMHEMSYDINTDSTF